MNIYDVIIIGGGPAGYTAALYAARSGLSTLVIEKMSIGGQMALTDIIDNYPGFDEGVDGITLGMKMQAGAERFGAETVYDEVVDLELEDSVKKVKTAFGEYTAKALIIAMGAEPKKLGVEGEDALLGRGVHYCAHCDGRFYKDKTVIVVGGGNSAAADALYLSNLAKKVTVIHRRDTLRATKIYHEPLLTRDNVEFLWNSEITNYLTDENKLIGAEVKNKLSGETVKISADAVFVSIGRSPSTDLLKGKVLLDAFGYVIADESTKTSIPGVFVAGDVRTKTLRQVVTAVSDGAVAAHEAEEYIATLG
jgi:thioredoxin reductase (NADPH)